MENNKYQRGKIYKIIDVAAGIKVDTKSEEPVKKQVNNFQPKKSAQEKAIRNLGNKNNAFADMLKNL